MEKRFKCTFHSFRGGLQCRVRGGVNPSPGNLGKRDWRNAGQTVPSKPPVALKGWWDLTGFRVGFIFIPGFRVGFPGFFRSGPGTAHPWSMAPELLVIRNPGYPRKFLVIGFFRTFFCHEWGVLGVSWALVDTGWIRNSRSTILEWSQTFN